MQTQTPLHQFSSVAQSCLTLWPHGQQHSRLPCPSTTPRVCSNSCPSSRWCHSTVSSSVISFSSCLQSFPASGSLQWISSLHQVAKGLEFSFSISPSYEYLGLISFRMDWFDLLQSKVFSRVFSNITVQKHQFFASGGQNIGASASASVLPMNIQDWFPLGLTCWISLLSKDSQESSPTSQFKSFCS